jgi:hypothetical protein
MDGSEPDWLLFMGSIRRERCFARPIRLAEYNLLGRKLLTIVHN